MAKDKIAYVCSHCGQESAKWLGKCPSCGQWNTFKEIHVGSDTGQQAARSAASELRTHPSRSHRMRLGDIAAHDEPRIDMIDGEFNRVLGGGLVPGSIVLMGGEPGIGKSTLTLQTLLRLPQHVLYVSGEESPHQIKMRRTASLAKIPSTTAWSSSQRLRWRPSSTTSRRRNPRSSSSTPYRPSPPNRPRVHRAAFRRCASVPRRCSASPSRVASP